MKPGYIVLIILGSLIVLGGIATVVYFFFLRERICKRQIREIDRQYQHLHALLIGQDAQYVKRLEIISRTNLLYVEIHTKFLKKFKEIRDHQDADSLREIEDLRILLDEKQYKRFKEKLVTATGNVQEYKEQVDNLNIELLRVVKPEEDCRQSALRYKEQFRRIKQDYYSKASELVLMTDSFDEVFKHIDGLFAEFEGLVESAQYDEANSILPEIDEILHEIIMNMQELPTLCAYVSVVVPDKIANVEIKYKEMVSEKYPLYHLGVPQTIETINSNLKTFSRKIKCFDISGIRVEIEEDLAKLDNFFNAFDEEKTAKITFEEKNEEVYRTVNLIERNFIKLRNTIPEVRKVFVINESHETKINDIQTEINKLGALKRSLDTYIHSATKQPYTLLVNKMNELSNASSSIIVEIGEYNQYISSLKSDAEIAYESVYNFYDKVKVAEELVRNMNIQKIYDKYNYKFDEMYRLLNEINSSLLTSPMNIDSINELLHSFYEIANAVLDDGEVSQDYRIMILAESAIKYCNKHRHEFSDINVLTSQAETFFEKGDFESAYKYASNALAKIKESNGRI